MKKLVRYSAFLFALCIGAGAFGQSVSQAEYFLGPDPGVGNGTPISIAPGTTINEALAYSSSGLEAGLHKIQIRVRDQNGLWGFPQSRFFYLMGASVINPLVFRTDIVQAEYFFDADPGVGKGTDIPVQKSNAVNKDWVAKTNDLDVGQHFLYVRTKSASGLWGMADTISMEINDLACQVPVVDFTFDTVDINTNIVLTDLSSNVDAAATYEWDVLDDGVIESNSSVFDTQFSTRGIYPIRLTITNPDGCRASAIRDVPVVGGLPSSLVLSANDSLLVGNTVDITAPAGYAYEWSTGETTQTITVDQAGTYQVHLSADGVTFTSEAIAISYFEPLTYDLRTVAATIGQSNGAALLTGLLTGGLPYTVQWSTGASGELTLSNLDPGSYSVDISTPVETINIPFIIAEIAANSGDIVAAEYFIGMDPGPGNGQPISVFSSADVTGQFIVDVGSFSPGLYKVNVRVRLSNGLWGPSVPRIFFVIDPTDRAFTPVDRNLTHAEYFVDHDPGVGQGTRVDFATAKTVSIDVPYQAGIDAGLHEFHLRVRQDDGSWSASKSVTFFVAGGRFEDVIVFNSDIVRGEYFFDNDPGVGKGHDLPVQKSDKIDHRPWAAATDGLAPGEHKLHIRLQSQDGIWNTASILDFTVTEEACTPPIPDFSFDTVGVGVSIGLVDLTTAVEADLSYAWDVLGDGVIDSEDPAFDTAFANTGIYPIKLTVTNQQDGCFASIVQDVIVANSGFPTGLIADKGDSLLYGDTLRLTAPAGDSYEWNTGSTDQVLRVHEPGEYYAFITVDGISYRTKSFHASFFNPLMVQLATSPASPGLSNGLASVTVEADGLPYQIIWSTGITEQKRIDQLAQGNYSVEVNTVLDTVNLNVFIVEDVPSASAIVGAEYFFGADPGPGNGTQLPINHAESIEFSFEADVSGFQPGLYKVNLRTQQANGLWGGTQSRFFYIIDPADRVLPDIERNIIGAEYFIDSDPGVGAGVPIAVSSMKLADIDVSMSTDGVSAGAHKLFVRTFQDDGLWSIPLQQPFYLRDTVRETSFAIQAIVQAEYFFDSDPGPGRGTPILIPEPTDTLKNRPWYAATDGLASGVHRLYVRVRNEQGVWGTPQSKDVFIINQFCSFPEVDFTYDTVGTEVNVGLTDLSSGIAVDGLYQWDVLGDGTIESNDPAFDTSLASGYSPVRLSVENAPGCMKSVVKDVLVSDALPGALTLSANDTLLSGDKLTITAPDGYTYLWSTGSSSQGIDVTVSGSYFAYLTNPDGTRFRSERIFVSFFDSLRYSLATIDSRPGSAVGSASLSVHAGGLPISISWSSGQADVFEVEGLVAGNYSVNVSTPLQDTTISFAIGELAIVGADMVAGEYFIDADPGPGNGVPVTIPTGQDISARASVTMAGLRSGVHHIYFRARRSDGLWGMASQRSFFISEGASLPVFSFGSDIIYAEYALDSLPRLGEGVGVPVTAASLVDGAIAIDVTDLTTGEHQLYLQVQDAEGHWSFSEPYAFKVCNDVPSAPSIADLQVCPGEQAVASVPMGTGTYSWYGTDFELIKSSADTFLVISTYENGQQFYVSEVNVEGCESVKSGFVVQDVQVDVFAGPDRTVPTVESEVVLDESFPLGGSWTGDFVQMDGTFSIADSGLGSHIVQYSIDSLGCILTDQMLVTVVPFDNDPPVASDVNVVISELPVLNSLVTTVQATDPEGDPIVYGFAKVSDNTDTAAFAIDPQSGDITVRDSTLVDFETSPSLRLQVEAADPYTSSIALVIVDVTNLDESPIFLQDPLFTILENQPSGTFIGQVLAEDPDGGSITYRLPNDVNGFFSIDAVTGDLFIGDSSSFDFEVNKELSTFVEVFDGSNSGLTLLTVTITDVLENPDPVFPDQAFTVGEHAPMGTVVGLLDATDPNDKTLSFAITAGNEGSVFAINTSGELLIADPVALDFESSERFVLTMIADNGTQVTEAIVTINVTDVSEAPVFGVTTLSLNENPSKGQLIGSLEITDPFDRPVNSIILIGNEQGGFFLSRNHNLFVRDTAFFNFEGASSHIIKVRASNGLESTTTDVTVMVNDVNEPPRVAPELKLRVDANATNGTVVGEVRAFDPEGNELTYNVIATDDNDGAFVFDPSINAMVVENGSALDFDTQSDYNYTFTVSDGEFSTQSKVNIRLTTLERDRSALIAIYNATGGDKWKISTNWNPEGIVSNEWHGVTVSAGRVVGLDLRDNNLAGDLPDELGDLTGLVSLNLSSNHITRVPDISILPSLGVLNLSVNRLGIGDLIANLPDAGGSDYTYNYFPQRKFGELVMDTIPAGTDLLISHPSIAFTPGNNYQWFRGEDSIPDGKSRDYQIVNIDYDKMGKYFLTVTNDQLPGLELQTRSYFVWATTDVFGRVSTDAQGTAFTDGEVQIFRVFKGPFERTDSAQVSADGAYNIEDVVLGDFILRVRGNAPRKDVLQTYYTSTSRWREADTLFLRSKADNIDILMVTKPSGIRNGAALVNGSVTTELPGQVGIDPDARVANRRKVKRAGCSLRQFQARGGRSLEEEGEWVLYAYVESNEEGEFVFENIDDGRYELNIEYPGVPMDPNSAIEFVVGGDNKENQVFSITADVTEEGIVVETSEVLYSIKPWLKDVALSSNPTRGHLFGRYLVYRPLSDLQLQVTDLTGQVLMTQPIDHRRGQREFHMDMTLLRSGVYFLIFTDEAGSFAYQQKVVKQ